MKVPKWLYRKKKLKIGDKVRILDGREMSDPNFIHWVLYTMCSYVGRETRVIRVFSDSVYLNIDQGTSYWAKYWVEKMED